MSVDEQGTMETVFKALAHPVRLAILDILRNGEACVCHLETALQQRQAYISQQLAVLREANLIDIRRDGLNKFYFVTRTELFEVIDRVRAFVGSEASAVPPSYFIDKCPCPHCATLREINRESPLAVTSQD